MKIRLEVIISTVILFGYGLSSASCLPAADINGDLKVDLRDLSIFSAAWLSEDGSSSNFDSSCDISLPSDGSIDIGDLSVFASNWLCRFSPPDPNLFSLIPAGEYQMGDHHDGFADAPVHAVYIDSFYIGKYEITNSQYCDYLNFAVSSGLIKVDGGIVYGADDSAGDYPYCDTYSYSSFSQIDYSDGSFSVMFKDSEDMSSHPVIQVSWYGAAAYCNWKSARLGYQSCYDISTWQCDFNKGGFRLATEAEWEYAARGGQHSPYYRYPWGDSIDGSMANYWFSGDPYETGLFPWTTPVGYYDGSQSPSGIDMANGYGLYDVAGGVFEWCFDWYDSDYYDISPYSNPSGPSAGTDRTFRGNAWTGDDTSSKVALRWYYYPDSRLNGVGFRVCINGPDAD